MNPAMMQQMHPVHRRRRLALAALWPPVLILIAYALLVLGLVSAGVYFVVLAAIVFFILGRCSVILATSEQDRQFAVDGIEATIEGLHRALDEETIPDELREHAENDLSMMVETLDNLDRMAPWRVRWRRRRERAKA